MAKQPIDFPGLSRFTNSRNAKLQRHGLAPRDETYNENPTIDGLVAAIDKPFLHGNRMRMFAPGAWTKSLANGKPKNFCVDHRVDDVYATTSDGLVLTENRYGLAMRLDLKRTKNSAFIRAMVECGDRRCLSIGCNILKSEDRKFGEHTVNVILEADIIECSIVRQGLVPQAFAYVANSKRTASPSETISVDFALEYAAHRIGVGNKRLANRSAHRATTFENTGENLINSLDRLNNLLTGLKAA